MGETMELTQDRIEEIAREVYKSDRFTPTDQVWCNLHWLTLFAKAIERETSSERDREIERLKAEIQMITAPVEAGGGVVANLRAQLSASQAREREAVDKLERWAEWDRDHPMGEVGLENPDAMAKHLATLTLDDLAPTKELFERKKRERERVAGLESALAAARKALEAYRAAYTPDRHIAPEDCFATGPMTGDPIADLIVCPGCIAQRLGDAALKGDSHAE